MISYQFRAFFSLVDADWAKNENISVKLFIKDLSFSLRMGVED
jgi:hypothetical protein